MRHIPQLLLSILASSVYSIPAGISVGNQITNAIVESNSTLYANAGNSQNPQILLNKSDKTSSSSSTSDAIQLADGNTVSNITAGNFSRIITNVGNSYIVNSNNGSVKSRDRPQTNSIGNTQIGDHGTLINNIGTTVNNNYHNITTNDTYQNITHVHQNITNQRIVQQLPGLDENITGLMKGMIDKIYAVLGQVATITFTFNRPRQQQSNERQNDVGFTVSTSADMTSDAIPQKLSNNSAGSFAILVSAVPIMAMILAQ